MKTKYIFGIALAAGLTFTACNDDDLTINTTPVMDASSVVTGSANPTLTSAALFATINGLADRNPTSYRAGFYYTTSKDEIENIEENRLNMTVTGSMSDNQLTATLEDLEPSTFVYYQAYITLSSALTFRGEIKSTYTTDALVKTPAENSSLQPFGVSFACDFDNAPEDALVGVVVSASDDQEVLRESGRKVAPSQAVRATRGTQSVEVTGLVPGTKYYYASFMDLGPTCVYGDISSFTTPAYDFDVDNDLVDLGLPSGLKWAKYNVGAAVETELGGLYGFGDVTGATTSFAPADYASADTYKTLNDVAAVAYQNKATLPSAADWEELFANCNVKWTTREGVAGYEVTGSNGNSIFLPAAGSRTINAVSEVGTNGYYLTGSASSANYYLAYQFTDSQNGRTTLPVYQAVAARAVSNSRNVKFNPEYLYQTWYLENNQDGMLHIWEGPFTQYGVTDNWGTVTNGENNPYQNIYWPVGLSNEWLGYTAGFDHGYMTLNEDGTVEVGRNKVTDAGEVYTDVQKGTFTIDADNKTITIDIPVLCADTWIPGTSGTLKILSLDGDALQIALPADDTYAYAANYYSAAKKDADEQIKVSLLCVGGDWGGTWGDVIDAISPDKLNGKHTATYNGAVNGAMVFTLDFEKLKEKYPDAMVALIDIKCDGQSIPFDATKFFYGDIEDNGNFRIELFNIWGKGSNDGAVDSPFSAVGPTEADWNFSFTESIEFTYVINTDASFGIGMVNVNPNWGGSWYTYGGNVDVQIVDFKYVASPMTFDAVYNWEDDGSDGFRNGSMLAYIDIANLYAFFPGTKTTLNSIKLDGAELTGWDPSKIYNLSADGAGVNHRTEFWNCWGPSASEGCAFGEKDGDVMPALGFNNSFAVNVTVDPKPAEVNF